MKAKVTEEEHEGALEEELEESEDKEEVIIESNILYIVVEVSSFVQMDQGTDVNKGWNKSAGPSTTKTDESKSQGMP